MDKKSGKVSDLLACENSRPSSRPAARAKRPQGGSEEGSGRTAVFGAGYNLTKETSDAAFLNYSFVFAGFFESYKIIISAILKCTAAFSTTTS